MHPVGPLSSRVYWIRRVGLVLVAVLVLIGMVWFLANRNSSSARQQSDATALGSGSAVPTLTGELAASSVSALPSVLPMSSALPSASPSASASASASVSVSASASVSDSSPSPSETAPSPSASVEATASGSAAPAASPTEASPAAAPSPEPTPAAPPPSYDPQGRLLCADADTAVGGAPSAPTFAAGQQPRLTMTVTNRGAQPCVRDLSGPLQIFTVFAADGARVWSTADCFPGQGSDVQQLAPGQVVSFTVKWSGTTSAPGCTGDRAVAPPGEYTLVAQLGGLSSPPAAFAITG